MGDVYAAASTIYELACGAPPFGSDGARGMAGLSPYRIKVDLAPRYCENVGHALRGELLEPREEALVGTAPLRARRVLRLVGYAACVAVTVAVCAGFMAQLELTRAVALALPLVAGLVLRARGRSTLAGMIRGAVGVLLGAATAGAILARALPEGLAPASLVPVLLCACSGAWFPMAIDYATLSEGGAQPAAASAAQPVDNAGEGA